MPFAIDQTDTEKQAQEQQQQAGQNISGTSSGMNLPGQTAGTMKPGAPKKSGQFQNIQRYISANQPQGEQIGQSIAGKVESEVGQAKEAGTSLVGGVQQVQAYNPQDVLSNLGGATEEQRKQYQATRQTGGYTGPSDVSGLQTYQPFAKEAEQAKTAVQQAGTEVGQRELLKDVFKRPTYSKGMTALDQALLSQSVGGREAIQNIGQKYGDIASYLTGQEQQAQQAIGTAQQQAQQNIQAFAPAEQAAQQAILSPIEQRAAEENVRQQAFNRMAQDVSDFTLNPETMAALGLSAGQKVFDLNLGQYINQPLSPATAQNIATTEERQRYNDLLNFLGTNAGQLGMGQPSFKGGNINLEQLKSDISGKQAEYDKVFAKPANQTFVIPKVASRGDFTVDKVIQQNASKMTPDELENWIRTSPKVGGVQISPDRSVGKTIIDQIVAARKQFGAQNIIKQGEA
jgi:hypothetical protein